MSQCLDSRYIEIIIFINMHNVWFNYEHLNLSQRKKNKKYVHTDIMLYVDVDNHDVRCKYDLASLFNCMIIFRSLFL